MSDDGRSRTGDTTLTLAELAEAIGAEPAYTGAANAETPILRCRALDEAGPGDVSFVSNQKYVRQLESTRASAVIVAPSLLVSRSDVTLLKSIDPYYAWSLALIRLHGHRRHPHTGVSPAAHIDPTATIGQGCTIYPGVFVGPRVQVGCDCILYPNVTLYDDTVLGDRVIVHAGASIGPDGFGFASHKDPDGVWRHHKIPQVGHVVVEDDVEIGSNTSIARGAVGVTRVGQGSKIDNNVAIGHGVTVGPHCLLVAQVGIAGSTVLGHHVTMAGQVGVAGHLKIGDGVTIAAQSGVMTDIDPGSTMIGSPSMPASHARRVYTYFTQLPTLVDRIKKLEQSVEELSDAGDESTGTA